ncbi:MAG: hypothetical protein HY235_12050 [Acidobacteria bacterium]|nr:hypothetical protein [Acidobacteriota bacterium]
MPSRIETLPAVRPSARRALDTFKLWSRKGHYYLGLYFLFFLWLFAFTGLLLNHSWMFAEFWPNRKVSKFERPVEVPQTDNDLDRARGLTTRLGIKGEIEWTAARPDSTVFEFRVNRPGHTSSVTAYPEQGRAVVEQIEINTWGIMRVLHTFTGVRAGDERNYRDWFLTTLWVISMDAVSIGLVIMVFSGLYMWYGLPAKRKLGSAALMLGTVCLRIVYLRPAVDILEPYRTAARPAVA